VLDIDPVDRQMNLIPMGARKCYAAPLFLQAARRKCCGHSIRHAFGCRLRFHREPTLVGKIRFLGICCFPLQGKNAAVGIPHVCAKFLDECPPTEGDPTAVACQAFRPGLNHRRRERTALKTVRQDSISLPEDAPVFHRIIKTFMIQTGDPTGTGSGSPGYKFADELPVKHSYDPGIVAMANAGPNTNGSQFFICTGADAAGLNNYPNYTQFGKVTDGMDVVLKIAAVKVQLSASGEMSKPVDPPVIKSITISQQ